MSHIIKTFLYLANVYTLVICYSPCKEYIVTMKEIAGSSNSSARELIALQDLQLMNHEDCAAHSSNESYVIQLTYDESEPICVLILKPELLEDIIIDDDSDTNNPNESKTVDKYLNKTKKGDKNEEIKLNNCDINQLQCLIRKYTNTCDISESEEDNPYENYNIPLEADSPHSKDVDRFIINCSYSNYNIIKKYSLETVEIIKKYNAYEFLNCTEAYKNISHKFNGYGGKFVMITRSKYKFKETGADIEDGHPLMNIGDLVLQFIPSNVTDCDKMLILNITKGRIISLLSEHKTRAVSKNPISILLKVNLVNCINALKSLETDDLELDIILNNVNDTKFNSFLIHTLGNEVTSSKRTTISCTYNEVTTELKLTDNDNATLECKFIEIEFNKTEDILKQRNTTEPPSTTTENPIEEESTTIETTEPPSTTTENLIEEESTTIDTKFSTEATINSTIESIVSASMAEIYTMSPKVIVITVAAVVAVIGSVVAFIWCFLKRRTHDYVITNTRDWTAMDETNF